MTDEDEQQPNEQRRMTSAVPGARGYGGYGGVGQLHGTGSKRRGIGFACVRERFMHPARGRNRCIARKYKGFRRIRRRTEEEMPARVVSVVSVVTVVTVVSVNCMVYGQQAARHRFCVRAGTFHTSSRHVF
ncbi:MAG: hypothetical protein ACOX63_11305 [Christensenellales bacterium]